MATNMKSLNGYGFDAAALGGKSLAEIMLTLYPVGAVYISANSTSPASLFGGTWESIGGRFLLGADVSYAAGSIGGEAKHTLTVSELPSHTHNVPTGSEGGYSVDEYIIKGNGFYAPGTNNLQMAVTVSSGGGVAHNNMPPYMTVYMWKRVS